MTQPDGRVAPGSIDVLVVAFCGWTALADTLGSLARWSDPGYRLTVFENSVKNYALTGLWNRFIEQSRRDVIALCNPDILVGPGWDTEALACFARHPSCAVVSPISNTAPHRERFGAVVPDVLEPGDVEVLSAHLASATRERVHLTGDERMAPGHCVLLRREAWQRVGGFDERIPFGGNDYDFNRRVVAAGMTLGITTRAFSFHRWGVSTGDARRLGQFDADRHEPRFRAVPQPVPFDEL